MALKDMLDRLSGDGDSGSDLTEDEFTAPDDLSSLDAADLLAPDPKPARRTAKVPRAVGKASAAQKRQVRDALLLVLTPTTGLLAMRDAHCGGAAFAQREAIVDAMVPIICRNPAMLRWFTAVNAPWMDYLALFTALQPVGAAIWQHHIKKDVTVMDGGEGLDYSAYTA